MDNAPEPQNQPVSQNVPQEQNAQSMPTSRMSKFTGQIHKHKKLITIIIILVLLSSIFAAYFLRNGGEEQQNIEEQTESLVQADETDDSLQVLKPIEPYKFAAKEYSSNQNGEFFQLISEGSVVLERSQYNWDNIQVWEDWIFFYSQEKINDDELSRTTSVHAFNFSDRTYLKVTDIAPETGAYWISQTAIKDDYLYIGFDEYRTAGSTYRCKLDEKTGCGPVEKIYDGQGNFIPIDNDNILIIDSFGDAGIYNGTFTRLNIPTKQEKSIASFDSFYNIGNRYITYDKENVLWFVEQSGDTNRAEEEGYYPTLQRIYAVNSNGDEVYSIRANELPRQNLYVDYKGEATPYRIYLSNKTEELYFDINTRKFSNADPYGTYPVTDRKTNAFVESLKLPDGYSIINASTASRRSTTR